MIVINSSAYDEFLNKHSDDNPITPPTNFVEQGLENKDEVPFHPDQNSDDNPISPPTSTPATTKTTTTTITTTGSTTTITTSTTTAPSTTINLENKDEVSFHPDQNKCDCSVLVNEKLDTKEKEGVEREIDYYYNDDVDNYEENEVNDYVPVVLIGHE